MICTEHFWETVFSRAGGRLEKSLAAKMAPQPARQPAIADFSAVSGKKKKNTNLQLKKKKECARAYLRQIERIVSIFVQKLGTSWAVSVFNLKEKHGFRKYYGFFFIIRI